MKFQYSMFADSQVAGITLPISQFSERPTVGTNTRIVRCQRKIVTWAMCMDEFSCAVIRHFFFALYMHNNFPMLTLHLALTTGVKLQSLYENPISNKFCEKSILKYIRISTNGHLSITASFFCPGGKSIHWLLLKPLYNGNGHDHNWKRVPNCQNNLSTTASFFSD